MSYRFMRIIVFFDLPTESTEDLRNYRRFRKFLIKNGYYMLQESVYCKLVLNGTAEQSAIKVLKQNKPSDGIVQVLSVTEKQFARMEYITGECSSDILSTDERLVVY